MNKIIASIIMALFTSVAVAAGGYNVGYNSKLVEQGVVTGTSLVTASANVELGSFGIAVDTYSTLDTNAGVEGVASSDGWFKRVDVSATYKFASSLADIRLGAKVRSVSQSFALGGVKDSIVPFATVSGNLFTVFPWQVTATIDQRINNNNFEGTIELPFPVALGELRVVPTVTVGVNDTSTSSDDLLKSGIRALNSTEKYYQGGLAAAYPTFVGELRAGTFVQTSSLSNSAEKTYGWYTSLNNEF